MNKDVMRPAGATAGRVMARLGSSLHVKGEISGNEDLHIDGIVEGAVQLGEGKLTVGATANVTADIVAREVVVCGKVKGNVHAKSNIEIKRDGSVIGDLTTAQIIIEDGAYFKGSIEIDRSGDKEADNNVSPGTAANYVGGRRGAEEYLITKECIGSYAQDRDNKCFAEFGFSHLRSGERYMFPFVLRCAIILPIHRAQGARP